MTAATVAGELQELPLPLPVSYAPQTWGWGVLAGIVTLLAAYGVWRAWRRYRRNRYRREALAALDALSRQLARDTSAPGAREQAVAGLAVVLKRTALAAWPATAVASLQGDAWCAFLNRTRGKFDAAQTQWLAMASYAPAGALSAVAPDVVDRLFIQARQWIRDHHVEA